jgi:hypothetical protein
VAAATVELALGALVGGLDRALAVMRVEGLFEPIFMAVDAQIGRRNDPP